MQKTILFALFVCALIVFASDVCYSSNETPPEQQHQWTEQAQNKPDTHTKNILGSDSQLDAAPKTDHGDKKKSNADEIVLQWLASRFDFKLTDALLVLFTFLLALKTGGLFRETAGLRDAADKQRIDMLRSVKASEQAADAAQKSANAAIAAERARFYVVEGENNFMDFVSTVIEWIDASGGKMSGEGVPFIKISFKTFGKSPGIIQEICCDLKFSTDPFDPVCTLRDVKENMIAAGNKTQEFLCTANLSIDEIKLLHQGAGHLWIHGRVYYKDVFNNKQVHRFFRRFTRITRLGSPDLYGLRSYNYKNYNEST